MAQTSLYEWGTIWTQYKPIAKKEVKITNIKLISINMSGLSAVCSDTQLGMFRKEDVEYKRASNSNKIVVISCGTDFILFTIEWCCTFALGNNTCGQLGIGSLAPASSPVEIVELRGKHVQSLCAGNSHSLCVCEGNLYGWGSNFEKKLGGGPIDEVFVPMQLPFFTNIKIQKACCSFDQSIVLTGEGRVYGWGGIAHNGDIFLVGNLLNITNIACGTSHSLAVCSDPLQPLWSWGTGSKGELGNGLTENFWDNAVCVSGFANKSITAISAGSYHSVAIIEKQEVYEWGDLKALGKPRLSHSAIPLKLPFGEELTSFHILDVACGSSSTLLLLSHTLCMDGVQNITAPTEINSPLPLTSTVDKFTSNLPQLLVNPAILHSQSPTSTTNLRSSINPQNLLRPSLVVPPEHTKINQPINLKKNKTQPKARAKKASNHKSKKQVGEDDETAAKPPKTKKIRHNTTSISSLIYSLQSASSSTPSPVPLSSSSSSSSSSLSSLPSRSFPTPHVLKSNNPTTTRYEESEKNKENITMGDIVDFTLDVNCLYSSFTINELKYEIGDTFAYDNGGTSSDVEIGKILSIQQSTLTVQKYYWPEDTCTGRQQFHLPNEIMLSEEKRELKIAQIVQKVHVTVEKIEKRGMVKESCNGLRRREMKELVCCRKYEADRKKFVALLKPPPAEVVEID